ncbi:MAG: hypothetical protein ABWZ66_11030 [Pyrinomonadaceae bacterium]
MTDAKRRRMDKLQREDVHMVDNAADFPADSPVDKVTVLIRPKMAEALELDARLMQELGEKRAAQEAKDDSRDMLIDLLRDFAIGAIAVDDEIPGIAAQVRVPRNRSDQNLIAAATAIHAVVAPHLGKFKDADLTSADHANLLIFRDKFTADRNAWESSSEEHAEAVGALDALFRDMMALSRKRSALVKLKYRNNPGKRAAWTVASHLERPPVGKKQESENSGSIENPVV